MGFTIGDIVVLLVVVVILAVYRQLDRNNRSLDKVKRFVERVQGEMDEIVAEKVTMLKDIGIEVDVHQKAAREVLKRIQGIEDDLGTRAGSLEQIGTRLTNYERALDELVAMTQRAEENIVRVRDESEYIDKVGKRIKSTQAKIEELESALPGIVSGFEKQNMTRLTEVESRVFAATEHRVGELDGRVGAAGARVQEFAEEIAQRQGAFDDLVTGARAGFEELNDRLLAEHREEMDGMLRTGTTQLGDTMEAIEGRIDDAGERFDRLETEASDAVDRHREAIARLSTDSEERLDELAQRARSLETESFAALRSYIDTRGSELRAAIDARAEDATSRLAERHDEWTERLADETRRREALAEEAVGRMEQGLAERVAAAKEALAGEIEQFKADGTQQLTEIQGAYESLRIRVDEWTEKNRQYVLELEQQVSELQERTSAAEVEQREAIDRQVAATDERLTTLRGEIDARTGRLERALAEANEALTASIAQRFEERTAQLARRSEEIEAQVQSIDERIAARISSIEATDRESSEQLAEARRHIESEREAIVARADALEQELTSTIDRKVQTAEQRVLGDLEKRLGEYEKAFGHRFERLEAVGGEIETLETGLRQSMDRIAERVRGEFRAFGEKLMQQREEDRSEASAAMDALREAMQALETGLNELKQRAYDNVSEKLKVFEDEFFADLRARSTAMEERIASWRAEVEARLAAMGQEGDAQRTAIEQKYDEELRTRLHTFSEEINGQLSRIDERITSFRDGVNSRAQATEEAFAALESSVGDELEALKERSYQTFRQEFALSDTRIRDDIKAFSGKLGAEIARLDEKLHGGTEELEALVEATRSEVTVWRTEVVNQLHTSEAEVSGQIADTRLRFTDMVQELKREFSAERQELVEGSVAERRKVRDDLDSLAKGLRSLEEDLDRRSQEALDEFASRAQRLRTAVDEHERTIGARLDERGEEYRALVGTTRDQFESMRERLIGKLEEQARTLATTLQEVDKRQAAFVEQTKIFERADQLKVKLTADIEALKGDIVHVEAMRGEVREIEGQFARIRKLSADAGEKMARFTADKRRIDLLEDDYKRLITLAQSVEGKIEQVSTSDESLQEITARLETLRELESEVEVRYDRLEKRRALIDRAADSLDTQAKALVSMEERGAAMERQLSEIPTVIADLSDRLKIVASARSQTEKAVQQLATLDDNLAEMERRMDELRTAREWLARTETRLEEIRRDAGEQIKLLGAITRDETRKNPVDGGAPSLSARETVQKLAHQGWNVDEIARATKVSKGEVELILELTARSK